MAGLPCSDWIGRCAAEVLSTPAGPPDLTLIYLPHLDYETQRLGPDNSDWTKLGRELDQACAPILDAAQRIGARVWVVNEYAHVQVDQPVYLNRVLRLTGLLAARPGPFGEQLDTFGSRAFAVCDHQLAHVYVRAADDVAEVRDLIAATDGVDRVYAGAERAEIGLEHPRSGEIVVLSKPNAWFAYPFWLDDAVAPDYARTVDIHRKPGYDPCELFLDPKLRWGKGRALRRLVQKKLGLRTLFDVIPLDGALVRGSHGLRVSDPADRPVLIGDGPAPADDVGHASVRDLMLQALTQ
jgi:predicted AlkP superfamily pyrophosphatase or phosphodiesterase